MAETVNQETNGTAAETQENEQRTFTQAEMNAIIQDRLTRERGKYADYEALKAKAAKFDEAEEAGKTELQKANEKADRFAEAGGCFYKGGAAAHGASESLRCYRRAGRAFERRHGRNLHRAGERNLKIREAERLSRRERRR